MKIKFFWNLIIVFLLIMLLTGCNRTAYENKDLFTEYTERILEAFLPFADETILLSTIEYIDEIIANESNKNITSIYYDKARLLYMLKRYDDALNELFNINDNTYDIYIATLLICLERNNEATYYLLKLIENNKIEITEMIIQEGNEYISRNVKNAIQGLLLLYILIGESYESIINLFANESNIQQQEIEILFEELFINFGTQNISYIKEIVLRSMWPGIEVAY